MRLFLGMILGALLTIVVTYTYDSMNTSSVATGPAASSNQTMVNWDVVESKWNLFKAKARNGWDKLAVKIDRG